MNAIPKTAKATVLVAPGKLVGSWVYTPQNYPTTFAFLKRVKGIGLPVEQLVTHHFPLEKIGGALETNVQMKAIKVAVVVE